MKTKIKKGYTLIELLIVMAIISIIAGAFGYSVKNANEANKELLARTQLTLIKDASNRFFEDNKTYIGMKETLTMDNSFNGIFYEKSYCIEIKVSDSMVYRFNSEEDAKIEKGTCEGFVESNNTYSPSSSEPYQVLSDKTNQQHFVDYNRGKATSVIMQVDE